MTRRRDGSAPAARRATAALYAVWIVAMFGLYLASFESVLKVLGEWLF